MMRSMASSFSPPIAAQAGATTAGVGDSPMHEAPSAARKEWVPTANSSDEDGDGLEKAPPRPKETTPPPPTKTTGAQPKKAPTWKLLHAHPHLNPLVDIRLDDAIKAYFYARPKKAPHGCSKYANHWYDAVVIELVSEESPEGSNRVAAVRYYDGAVERDVEFSNIKVRI